MIETWIAGVIAVVYGAIMCWGGYRWGQKDERLWWTRAADSDYHMVDQGDKHYTVMHTAYFVDHYHNPLARYRRRDEPHPLYDVNVRGYFP